MGVETVVDEVEYKKRIQQPYALFNLVLSEDIRYRVESTPVSLTAAKIGENDGGWYKYRLPKMPMGILKSLYCFFADVAEKFKTEVLVRVYYDPAAEKYVLEVPEQKTAPGLVVTDQGLIPQYWPVMDIHSHCYYPESPSFSIHLLYRSIGQITIEICCHSRREKKGGYCLQ